MIFFVLNIFYKSGERGRERENKNERKRTYIYTGSCAINYIAKVRKNKCFDLKPFDLYEVYACIYIHMYISAYI